MWAVDTDDFFNHFLPFLINQKNKQKNPSSCPCRQQGDYS